MPRRHGVKLSAKRKKLLQNELAQRDETADPVVKKVHKKGKAEADPIRGRFANPVGDKALVLEYEPDSELRDTEQVPLLEEGGIEAFIRREVLPHAAGCLVRRKFGQDRLRDQLQPLLLQAAAAATAGRDPGRHSGVGEGNGRAAWARSWEGATR